MFLACSVSAATKSSWIPGRGQHARGGGAVLPGVEVAGDGDRLGRGLEVGVVEDHDRRLAAELQVHPLDVARGGRRRPPCPARTEPVIATSCGIRCSTRARPVSRSPQTTLSTPAGSTSAASSASRSVVSGRGVAGLEDDGVAGRQRGGDLPDGHHHRVVPGRHLADDADRLPPDPAGVPGHVLGRGLALQRAGGAGEEPDLVDHRRDLLAGGQPERLAGVLALQRDQLVGVLLDERRRAAAAPAAARTAWCPARSRTRSAATR